MAYLYEKLSLKSDDEHVVVVVVDDVDDDELHVVVVSAVHALLHMNLMLALHLLLWMPLLFHPELSIIKFNRYHLTILKIHYLKNYIINDF